MIYALLLASAVICAIGAIGAKRLLASALWLAGASALISLVIYMLGAPEVAVVELSVGAGLVTVLFVFAINITGDESLSARSIIPRPVSWILIAVSALLIALISLPKLNVAIPVPVVDDFARVLWEQRGLDVLLQVALIFTGVLGVLGLISEARHPASSHEEVHP